MTIKCHQVGKKYYQVYLILAVPSKSFLHHQPCAVSWGRTTDNFLGGLTTPSNQASPQSSPHPSPCTLHHSKTLTIIPPWYPCQGIWKLPRTNQNQTWGLCSAPSIIQKAEGMSPKTTSRPWSAGSEPAHSAAQAKETKILLARNPHEGQLAQAGSVSSSQMRRLRN